MSASEFNGYQYRLKTTMEVCLNHINNNTFDEDDFKYCFSQFEGYMKTYTEYYEEHGKYPNSIIDERKMSKLYSYYNNHTRTYDRYDSTGKKQEEVPTVNSDDYGIAIGTAVVITAIVFLILLLNSCSHAEGKTINKIIDKLKRDGIVLEDSKFIPTDISTEVIRPEDYPIRKLK